MSASAAAGACFSLLQAAQHCISCTQRPSPASGSLPRCSRAAPGLRRGGMRAHMGWLLPLLLLGAALGVSAVASAGPAHALLAFAAAARGDNARALPDWQPGTDYCGWSGVACDDGAAVTALHLPRSGLRGQLAPDLALLPSLQTMWVYRGVLQGEAHFSRFIYLRAAQRAVTPSP
ncbi:hypothetical protein ABPG75_005067 [Micractinium tetrahymenae]